MIFERYSVVFWSMYFPIDVQLELPPGLRGLFSGRVLDPLALYYNVG